MIVFLDIQPVSKEHPPERLLHESLPPETGNGDTGRVIANFGQSVKIATRQGVVKWKPPHRESWVVGDMIQFVDGRPKTVLPRQNELSRMSGRKGASQALAANIDWLVIVTACGESFKPGLIDRFIVASSHAGIKSMIVLNKIDLENAPECKTQVGKYKALGFPVYYLSALTGEGIDAFKGALKNSISSMAGHSGVGKTSIINLLAPGSDRMVREIHKETQRGRHTTTNALMVGLPSGGAIIDSPGIRIFSPAGVSRSEVAAHFPGFLKWLTGCKFRDCLHVTEPDCSIRNAVNDGSIDPDRYSSYLRLIESI
ncbi:Ribosome small subunit-stimulated GTPase EngC [hydrothermal vent metagenome]|uniref:Ribosome small subunit-stimulated GTPase EngC n=1 Tax=hydrothermal vent metagenome TaxID=652676 RepID=A0A3B1C964_9ZZZZ